MRILVGLFLLLSIGCTTQNQSVEKTDITSRPGWVSVFQTFTSGDQTSINILRPRLAPLAYYVAPYTASVKQFDFKNMTPLKVVKTIRGPKIHWEVDRVHITGLKPAESYRLLVVNKRRKKIIDWRYFHTLDLNKQSARFIVGSCMSDSHAYEHVRSKIWKRMETHSADFLMLLGDQVYVDDFDFVKRGTATEFDLWTRYIDSFRKIPLFQSRDLIPILAVWDDHDYGTNNSDKTFKSKKAARKVFQAFFGGVPIKGVTESQNAGVFFSYQGFGQKFMLMDDRYFREPSSKNKYGQWGKGQHQWFQNQLKASKTPVWIANGGQFFTNATFAKSGSHKGKQVNESLKDDHPNHFNTIMKDLKTATPPIMFLSGDIHYSEIVRVEPEMLGYETYEITSSPVHSFIYRSKTDKEVYLDNPRRLVAHKDHNYVVVDSTVENGEVRLKVESFGVKQSAPYFSKELKVKKN